MDKKIVYKVDIPKNENAINKYRSYHKAGKVFAGIFVVGIAVGAIVCMILFI